MTTGNAEGTNTPNKNEIEKIKQSDNTKLDDDILFVKDGSFEHLVYQVRPRSSSPTMRSLPPRE